MCSRLPSIHILWDRERGGGEGGREGGREVSDGYMCGHEQDRGTMYSAPLRVLAVGTTFSRLKCSTLSWEMS